MDIDTSRSISYLVKEVLLSSQSDLLIKNISYKGHKKSIGIFEDELEGGILKSGIILSTGDVFDAIGPNKSKSTGSKSSGFSDNDLQSIATGVVNDVAILEFDFLALRDSIEFIYVFASEEYPEYIDRNVNDVFGFFIKEVDKDNSPPYNLAKLEDGITTVSIDNINHLRNEEYYLKSEQFEARSLEFWRKNPDMARLSRTFEYDGFTVPLKAKLKLKEGKWYHLKMAIGDVGDRFYDSAVLIKTKSMGSKGNKIANSNEVIKTFIKGHLPEIQRFDLNDKGEIVFDLSIAFNTNEAILQKASYPSLNQLLNILKGFPSLKINIIGHTDNIGKTEENLSLSIERSKAVKNYLVLKGITQSRIQLSGKGDLQPKVPNTSEDNRAINRRVEFELIY